MNLIVITDGDPLGIGLVIKLPNGTSIVKVSYILPFKRRHETSDAATEAKYQNCREFLRCIFGISCLHQLYVHPCHIKWVNDNAAALQLDGKRKI